MKTTFYGLGIIIIVLVLLALFTLFQTPSQRAQSQDISFSQFLNEVEQGRVREVLIQGAEISGTFADGRGFQTYAPNDPTLIQRIYAKGVTITARAQQSDVPWFVSLLISWLPFIVLMGLWIVFFRILHRIQLAVEKLSDKDSERIRVTP
jgi:cell division protease FtsH